MKKNKINKYLLFIVVVSILYLTSLTVFAAHTDGRTEVIARIETVTNETTYPDADNSGSDFRDESNVPTGDAVSVCVIIALFTLIISIIVILLCINNKGVDTENKAN